MIFGVCSGPLLGICLLGMLTERVNSTGVYVCVLERERENATERAGGKCETISSLA